jgi:hypothetical protein
LQELTGTGPTSSCLTRRTPQFVLVNDSGDPQCLPGTRVSHYAAPAEELNGSTRSGQKNPAADWRVRAKPRRRQQKQPIATEVRRVRLCFPISSRSGRPPNEHRKLHREADCSALVSHPDCTLTDASLTRQARECTSTSVLEVAPCPQPLLPLPVRPEGCDPPGSLRQLVSNGACHP